MHDTTGGRPTRKAEPDGLEISLRHAPRWLDNAADGNGHQHRKPAIATINDEYITAREHDEQAAEAASPEERKFWRSLATQARHRARKYTREGFTRRRPLAPRRRDGGRPGRAVRNARRRPGSSSPTASADPGDSDPESARHPPRLKLAARRAAAPADHRLGGPR